MPVFGISFDAPSKTEPMEIAFATATCARPISDYVNITDPHSWATR